MNLHFVDEARCGDEESAGLGESNGRPVSVGARMVGLLSKRQQEILLASCRGTPDKIIADSLGVSPRTLEGHWRAIHRKLGSLNRCQAGFLFAVLWENTHGKIPA